MGGGQPKTFYTHTHGPWTQWSGEAGAGWVEGVDGGNGGPVTFNNKDLFFKCICTCLLHSLPSPPLLTPLSTPVRSPTPSLLPSPAGPTFLPETPSLLPPHRAPPPSTLGLLGFLLDPLPCA